MIRILGITFLIIIVEWILVSLSLLSGSSFLLDFITNHSLEIMGTLLALNLASSVFLIGNLLNIESRLGKEIFTKSKSEIKHNILFMLVVFVLQLAVLSSVPAITESSSVLIRNSVKWLNWIALFLFLSYIFCIYEVALAMFVSSKLVFENSKTNKKTR